MVDLFHSLKYHAATDSWLNQPSYTLGSEKEALLTTCKSSAELFIFPFSSFSLSLSFLGVQAILYETG